MKINLRSPYYVNVDDAGLDSCILQLFIHSGDVALTGLGLTYTLNEDAINGEVTFEISQLAKEYLDYNFNGEYNGQNIWVGYRTKKTINGVEQSYDSLVILEGFYGYGYFEDEPNPQNDQSLLQSNYKMIVPTDGAWFIPVKTENLTDIDFYPISGGVVNETYNFNQNNSQSLTAYIGIGSGNDVVYLFQDGDEFLFQDGNNFAFNLISAVSEPISKMVLNYTTGSITVNVDNLDGCENEPIKTTFVNKFGALQDVYMFGNNRLSLSAKGDQYENNILQSGSYDISQHQNKTLTKQGKESITLNTGYYPESFNEVFQQLMLAEFVWVHYNNQVLPLNVSDSSIDYKQRKYDKLINYTIQFDFAFDKINKIR